MTADHLRPLVEHASISAVFGQAAALLAQNMVPEEVMGALRCGRLIALKKPDGGVRGIVVGDVMRRVVVRTIAQQVADRVEEATSPHQYALKTKAGCKTVAHILQVLTDADPNATVMSRWNWSVRPHLQECDDERREAFGRWRTDSAFRQSILRATIDLLVAR